MRRIISDRLNPGQKKNIQALCAACCRTEPITLALPLPTPGQELTDERFFLLYDEGQLMSVIHLFYPDGVVGELIGFTHPAHRKRGYFRHLLSLASDYAEEIGLEQVYVISDKNSADTDAALVKLGLECEYAEYMLGKTLGGSLISDTVTDSRLEPSTASDRELTVSGTATSPLTAELFSQIFQTDIAQCEAYLEDITSDERIHTYVLYRSGSAIGQTQLTFMGDMAYISGFGILPEYRRRGYGLMFLNKLETLLAEQSITQLTLQVSSQNKTALSLYRKDGFEILEALHYYPLFEE